jgi:hypothetical protein
VLTPDGEKGSRFIDVAAVDKTTGEIIEGVQVGRETKGKIPVARERRAIKDIHDAAPDIDIKFRPYNR